MIDSGDFPDADQTFIPKLFKEMRVNDFRISHLFASHGIFNHFGGTKSILDLHSKMGLPQPKVMKRVTKDSYVDTVYKRYPQLQYLVKDVREPFEI